MKTVKEVFSTDPDLKIREELIGIHAINAFVANDSSARSHMMSQHISQILTIEHGDEKIIQTGLEKQFGANTFSKKTLTDVRVLRVIPRYKGISATSVYAITEIFIIVEDIKTGELDYLEIPYHFSLHQYFGFKYKWNTELINNLMPGDIVPKDTIFADSPTITDNSGYCFGINANVLLATVPEVAEDGVVVSKSMSERLTYSLFETRVVEFGSDTFPLNIYGDENNYKAFPEIGEMVNDDSVIMVLRDYDTRLSPALTSKRDVMEFNPTFDKAVYVKGPGAEKVINGYKVMNGKVVDIKAYHSPKFKREIYTDTANAVNKYVDGYKRFHSDILGAYDELSKTHYTHYKDNNMKITPKFHRLLLDSMAIVNPDDYKLSYSFRNEPLDLYRLEFTIEYRVSPSIGAKISDLHGKFFN